MFCGNCGAKNADNAAFCAECGAKINTAPAAAPAPPAAGTAASTAAVKNSKVGIIAIAAVALVVVLMVFFLFGGRSYEATVDQFINAQFDGNAKALFELIPDDLLDYALAEEGYTRQELNEFIDDANDMLESQISYLDMFLGDNWKVTYEIVSVENIAKDALADLKETYKETGVKVSDAKNVEIELTIKAGELETTQNMDISLIKVGRSWYLDIDSMGSLF